LTGFVVFGGLAMHEGPFYGDNDMTPTREAKVQKVLNELLDQILVRGFHGAGMIRFTVRDGKIGEIEETLERKHR
jgi:hypothetical protein